LKRPQKDSDRLDLNFLQEWGAGGQHGGDELGDIEEY
jgi:hypothetical protein